ncbi:hypothetical protein SAMN04487996_10124 [Dyadobacter soli]|uniref:Uncharacterized protein n=1 Tax=Dyadobacter soli TaxID=659014 RepID=A0A1G6UNX5_9BACT|nr:hypothetical protein [Dyadobacter soli]SDD43052.1 hypothetical protein SAMN04487996_10124 [Dyadobacter soli]
METLNLEILNPGPILTDMRGQLQTLAMLPHHYLRRPTPSGSPDFSIWDFGAGPLGVRESALPEVLQLMGIRSLTLNTAQDLSPLYRLSAGIPHTGDEENKWRYLMSDAVTRVLQPLLSNCRTIAFHDWAGLSGASNLWTILLREAIRPLGSQGIEFVFYLGDPLTRRTFQVEEAIDVITDFSEYGQVTIALDEEEAVKLWMVLNGVHEYGSVVNQTFPDLKRKYISIFRTINIDRLVVYSATQVMLFTKQTQLVLARKKVASSFEIAPEARDHFMEGFCIGLVRQMDIVRCLALGLVVFGSRTERHSVADHSVPIRHNTHRIGATRQGATRQGLVDYIDQWVDDLQQQEIMYLYQ